TALGLGTIYNQDSDAVSITGGSISGITELAVADGGTGRSSWNQYAIPYMTNATTFGEIQIATSSFLLAINGTATGYEWVDVATVGNKLTQEEVEDYAGALVENVTGTHSLITVTYDDATNDMDFIVSDDLSLYDNGTSSFITLNDFTSSISAIDYATTTGIFTLNGSYIIPTSASTSEYDTAFGWGNHAIQNYFDLDDGALAIANGGTGSTTAAGARTELGLEIGLDVQAYDSDLVTMAGLNNSDSNFIVGSASGWVVETGLTARTSLGLGTVATQDADSVNITGGSITGITDLAVADGGTGRSSWTQYAIPYMTSSTTFGEIGIGTNNYLLAVNGTTGYDWVDVNTVGTQLTQEQVEDYAGLMVALGTGNHSLITVTYDDTNNDMDFIVENDLSLYNNSTSSFITLSDLSEDINGITLSTTTTGIFSLTAGYVIPTTASTTEYDTAYGWGNHSTQNYFDLDDGALAIANGGTGSTSLDNLITLGTHTTGNYLANATGTGSILVTGALGEGVTRYIDVIDDSITPTELNVSGNGGDTNILTSNGAGGFTWVAQGSVGTDTVLSQEQVEDYTGVLMATSSPYSLITVAYNDNAGLPGTMNFTVNDDLSLYDNSTSSFFSTISDILDVVNGGTGLNTLTQNALIYASSSSEFGQLGIGASSSILQINATGDGYVWAPPGSVGVDTKLSQEEVEDFAGTLMATSSPYALIEVVYDDVSDQMSFNVTADLSQFSNATSSFITWSSLESQAVGLDYSTTTGIFSLASGYEIPTTANTLSWTNTATLVSASSSSWTQAFDWGDHSTFNYFIKGTDVLSIADGGTNATNTADALTNLGLVIGTDVQAYDADLMTFAGISPQTDIVNFLSAADNAAAQTSLGLGSMATQNEGSVSISGGTITGITDLTVADGGTGRSSWTQYAIPFMTDSTTFGQVGIGASSTLLRVNSAGTGYEWVSASGVGVDTTLTQENVEDYAGAMIGTTTLITITYNDNIDGKIEFTVENDLALYDNSNSLFFSTTTDVLGIDYGGTGSTTALGARENLGLAIGTDIQEYNSNLATIAGLAHNTDYFMISNGTDWDTQSTSSVRSTLGLGTMAIQDATSVSITGGSITGITDLAVADGGTGRSSWTQYAIPYMTDSTTFGQVGIGASSTLLRVNAAGTGYEWVSASGVGVDTTLTQENVEDYAGAMVANPTGTHSLITITYDDTNGDMDFIVSDDLSLYDNGTSSFITLNDLTSSIAAITYATSTGIFTLDGSYIIPTTASTSEYDTAFAWGDHSTFNYFVKGTDVLSIADGGTGSSTAAGARTELGLEIGTDVQAFDSVLLTYAGIDPSSDIQTFLGSDNNSIARNNLGLGSLATLSTVNNDNWSGSDLAVDNGGTGRSSWTQYAIPYMTGTTTFGEIEIATSSYLLSVNGTGDGYEWVDVNTVGTQLTQEQVEDYAGPLMAAASPYSLISVTYNDGSNNMDFVVNDDLSLYSNATSSFFSTDGGVLAIANGGTGSSTAIGARTELGLEIGADVQAFDSVLLTYAGIDPSSDIQTFLGSNSSSTARTSLGLGTMAIQNEGSVSIIGGSITGITDLAVADGGTGRSTWTPYAIPYMTSSTTFGEFAIGTSTYLLQVNGTEDGYEWVDVNTVGTQLNQEQVEDYAGAFVARATGDHSFLSITYQDGSDDMDFILNTDLDLYDNGTSSFINLTELSASSTQGLTYDNINGEFSVTSGRIIPLSASTTLWNNTYNLVNASSSDWTTAFDWGNHATQGYFDLDDGALAIINGGTGSTTAAGARTELGLEIGADVQAWNNNLDDIVGLTHGTDLFMVSNGTDWDTQSSTTVRTTLGLANVFTNSDYAINSAGTLGDVWLSDGSGVGGWSATNTLGLIGLDVINSLNSGYVPYSDGTNLINSGVYYDGTNVGIGTSTAGFLLTIGATSTDQFLVNNIGQITDGTWMGDTIDIAYGGTGVTNVADFLN
ncbi:MAG: hypothetical protein PF440_05600, partial [Thiomicrorhabdus sp.]|nr:hypothetical protein [Thiomicrorhabdus sp.]